MADQLDRLSRALADHYRIERELGAGGMATVYLAEDLKHHRKVAVKVLRPDLAATLGPERFLREIEIAAGLHHPHILPLYDSGDADGFLYYVMPYEQGQSLRDRLARGGELPIPDAVRVLRDVVDALAHAHAHGVVHRDIKPENILLSGQHALVTDFGVAKAVSEATGRQKLTTAGVALGTPAYMAPEQAAADPNIDQRADIYAVGVVGYELLTGQPPFTGIAPQQILAAHLTEKPSPVSTFRETVPPALETLVMRCLEKKPADRWQSTDEIRQQLEALATPSGGVTPTGLAPAAPAARATARWRYSVLGGIAVLLLLGALGIVWFQQVGRAGTLIGRDILARSDLVLIAEFANRTDDSSLAQTVTDAVRVDLQQSRVVQVMTQQNMWDGMRRMGLEPGAQLPDSQVQEMAEREGAKAYVLGDIGKLGAGYQLSARVIATADGTEALTVRVTAEDDAHLIDAVGQLGHKLRRSIGESLRSVRAAPSLARVTTTSLPALRAFMAGVRAENSGDRPRAITLIKAAVSLDTAFAMAWRALGAIYANNDWYELSSDALDHAYRYRDRLPNAERLRIEGLYHEGRGEVPQAEAAYLQLIQLDSSRAGPWVSYSNMLLGSWRWPEAEQVALRAIADDPKAAVAYWNAIEAQVVQRRFLAVDSTLAVMRRNLPDNGWLVELPADVLLARRDFDSAEAYLRALPQTDQLPRQACFAALQQGHLAEWDRCEPSLPNFAHYMRPRLAAFLMTGGSTRERASLERAARDTATLRQEPFFAIVTHAVLGQSGEAERQLQAWRSRVGANDRAYRVNAPYAEGAIAATEGRWHDAAKAFLEWNRSGYLSSVHLYNRGLAEAANAVDQAGMPDSAIALYERALALPSIAGGWAYEASWYAGALRRLGELHEARGDRAQAIEYYREFIDLWKDADPVLQPQVREIKERLGRLVGEQSGRGRGDGWTSPSGGAPR